jgi:hypothetical protein
VPSSRPPATEDKSGAELDLSPPPTRGVRSAISCRNPPTILTPSPGNVHIKIIASLTAVVSLHHPWWRPLTLAWDWTRGWTRTTRVPARKWKWHRTASRWKLKIRRKPIRWWERHVWRRWRVGGGKRRERRILTTWRRGATEVGRAVEVWRHHARSPGWKRWYHSFVLLLALFSGRLSSNFHLPGRGGGKPGGGPKPIGPVWGSIGFAWPLSA